MDHPLQRFLIHLTGSVSMALAGCAPRIVMGPSTLDVQEGQQARLELRAEGGVGRISWADEKLPDWMAADSSEGRSHIIKGTLEAGRAGKGMSKWDVRVRVSDAWNRTDTLTECVIVRRPLKVRLDHVTSKRVGDPAEIEVYSVDHDGRVDWKATNLPYRWMEPPQNGEPRYRISGSMPMGSSLRPRTVTFTATDSLGAQGTRDVSIQASRFQESFPTPPRVHTDDHGNTLWYYYRVKMNDYTFVYDPQANCSYTAWVDTENLEQGDSIRLIDNPPFFQSNEQYVFPQGMTTVGGRGDKGETFPSIINVTGLQGLQDGEFSVKIVVDRHRIFEVPKVEVIID